MLTESQAQIQVEKALPGIKVKAWTRYQDLYLIRVEYPSEEEKDWDPFFSVDILTGEVYEFSVLTDGDINEIAALKWTDI